MFARTFCKNDFDADDLVQETLSKAIANIAKFQPGTNLKAWMFTIMRNAFYTSAKLRKREQPGSEECVSDNRWVGQTQDWAVQGGEVRASLDALPRDQREILVLIGILGVSYEEAADMTGCAIGTVKSRLNRARRRMLALLETETVSELFETSVH
ncbi:sigma-70 family RNA polymerase sigma factor [Amorphus coralli]|uniref:sigma-70 family RNA polymerase sigma factor n=1 Tax=Amorphus coralli TaxID=340680 RepID=UPI000687D714